jgi:hypothetical protein
VEDWQAVGVFVPGRTNLHEQITFALIRVANYRPKYDNFYLKKKNTRFCVKGKKHQ